jgi:hypothetical protein
MLLFSRSLSNLNSALSNVTLPSTLEDSLVQLNNSLPTLADLKTKIDQLIQTPFEDLKTQVNQSEYMSLYVPSPSTNDSF